MDQQQPGVAKHRPGASQCGHDFSEVKTRDILYCQLFVGCFETWKGLGLSGSGFVHRVTKGKGTADWSLELAWRYPGAILGSVY